MHFLAAIFSLALVATSCGSSSDESSGSDDTDSETTAASDETTDDSASSETEDEVVLDAKIFVEGQLAATEGFDGPEDGPSAQEGKKVIYVASDLTNGGVAAVEEAAKEAAGVIGWEFETINGQGTAQGRSDALNQAVAQKPDGIILGGFDANEQSTAIDEATSQDIPVVGWHAAADVGPDEERGLFNNVTTDPLEVSRFAGKLAIAQSDGTAGVVIFTDSQFEIAVAKAEAIKEEIETCAGCSVFEIKDTPISDTDAQMPAVISQLLQQHGDDLTHLLAINDGYFGGAAPALRDANKEGAGPPFNISAGDGDAGAFDRIRNQEYQFATVAEPLSLQGWQIIDELNRAFAGEGPSDYVAPPALVTPENITDSDVFDPDSGYRDNYDAIWNR